MKRVGFIFRFFVPPTIIAIIALAPAPGFITLTIPDEDGVTQSLGIPDLPHLGKRAENISPLQFDAIFNVFKLALALAFGYWFVLSLCILYQRRSDHKTGIRGPPRALA